MEYNSTHQNERLLRGTRERFERGQRRRGTRKFHVRLRGNLNYYCIFLRCRGYQEAATAAVLLRLKKKKWQMDCTSLELEQLFLPPLSDCECEFPNLLANNHTARICTSNMYIHFLWWIFISGMIRHLRFDHFPLLFEGEVFKQ